MTDAPSLVDRWFERRDGELWVEGVAVSELAREYGTPLFVHSRRVLARSLAALREALPPRFDVYYSIKANPNQALLKFFLAEGCGLEVASVGELAQALAAGCAPERVLFAGPGKTEAELTAALEHGIGEIHVESFVEIDRVAGIAARLGTRAPVALRVNPAEEARGGAMQLGGKPTPFGIDEERLDEAVDRAASRSSLDLAGVHLFTGTQILDHEVLLRQYAKGLEIARRVAARLGRPLRTVDFGGGLGIPYFPQESELDLDALRPGLAALVARHAGGPELSGARLVLEPGRFLAGPSGVYVTRVNDVKESRGKRFVVVDGGMNHHLAASGNLGQVIRRNFPSALLGKIGAEPAGKVDVVGPLCTPLDVLARDAALPEAEVGDLFGVFQSGAYARTSSPHGFLSHPSPAEVLVDGPRHRSIRARGTVEELLRGQDGGD